MHPNTSNGFEETDSYRLSSDLSTRAVAQADRQTDRKTHIQINKFNLKSYEKTKNKETNPVSTAQLCEAAWR